MNDQRTAGKKAGGLCRIIAQRVTGAPQRAIARKADAAGCVSVIDGEANRILIRFLDPVSGQITHVTQNAVLLGLVIGGIIMGTEDAATLGDNHAAARREQNIGNRHTTGNRLDFHTGITGEAAVGVDADGPDLRIANHAVVETALEVGQPPDAAAFIRETPGIGVRGIKSGACDIHPVGWIHHNRGKTRSRPAIDTMIECAKIIA